MARHAHAPNRLPAPAHRLTIVHDCHSVALGKKFPAEETARHAHVPNRSPAPAHRLAIVHDCHLVALVKKSPAGETARHAHAPNRSPAPAHRLAIVHDCHSVALVKKSPAEETVRNVTTPTRLPAGGLCRPQLSNFRASFQIPATSVLRDLRKRRSRSVRTPSPRTNRSERSIIRIFWRVRKTVRRRRRERQP